MTSSNAKKSNNDEIGEVSSFGHLRQGKLAVKPQKEQTTISGQESNKKFNVSPSDLMLQNAPAETPQRFQYLQRSKEAPLNVSNFLFKESPDVNGFADHERAGLTSGKTSKCKLEIKKDDSSLIATPVPLKCEQST